MTTPPPGVDVVTQQMALLYQQSPLMLAVFDADDSLQFANPAFRALFELGPDERTTWAGLMRRAYQRGIATSINTTDFEAWLASARSRRGKLPYRAFESDLKDGRWFCMTETVSTEGWMLCAAFETTEFRVSGRRLRADRDVARRAAQTDPLTGISNRSHVLQLLEAQLAQLSARQRPCGLVMLDLDHFKRVNDTYGHVAGDAVLRHFAQLVAGTLRLEDGFGRLGGEEFMLLVPGIEPDDLARKIGLLLAQVRESVPLPEVPAFRYTCSAGLLMLSPELDAIQNIRDADRALYVAKRSGRDRWAWAGG
ncbi:sensor domain-containing diguanylate cyclase [Rhodoferax sp.]|uniref:sensor domain-containing diguanylate cyclase n=1 Tax=Rhodoferax sp. TaxID=50421 RepID=UPI0025FDAEFD|nr:sensor domain-containing diguanylate cyclase [Rhodoferax sp.]